MSDIPIHSVLEHYGWHIPSTRTTWQTVKCQVHGDTHGSCRVNDQYVYCLACDFRGDAIDVVRHYRPELSFREAKSEAEQIAGIVDAGGGTGPHRGGPQGGRTRSGAGRTYPTRPARGLY